MDPLRLVIVDSYLKLKPRVVVSKVTALNNLRGKVNKNT